MIKLILNAPLEYLRRADVVNGKKILHVLEYICCAEKDCSISDIVNNCDVDKCEIYQWLEALVETGYIIQDEKTGLYYPTLKNFTLGNWILKNIKDRKLTSAQIKQRCLSEEEFSYLVLCCTKNRGVDDSIEQEIEPGN